MEEHGRDRDVELHSTGQVGTTGSNWAPTSGDHQNKAAASRTDGLGSSRRYLRAGDSKLVESNQQVRVRTKGKRFVQTPHHTSSDSISLLAVFLSQT
jgi:hypothetical protein